MTVVSRLDRLENLMEVLTQNVITLSEEMKEFKDEMREFKDEMKEFKDDIREFKDDIREDTKQMKKENNKMWGDLANRMGTVIEDFISPSVSQAILDAFNQEIISIFTKVKRIIKIKGERLIKEFDVIALSDSHIYLIESKTTVSDDKIDKMYDFIDSEKYYLFFPNHKNLQIRPIMASINIDENLITYMKNKNIYPMTLKGNLMKIII